ncbi:hypothetical protein GINT2_002005 [Glugoides intestinalis]
MRARRPRVYKQASAKHCSAAHLSSAARSNAELTKENSYQAKANTHKGICDKFMKKESKKDSGIDQETKKNVNSNEEKIAKEENVLLYTNANKSAEGTENNDNKKYNQAKFDEESLENINLILAVIKEFTAALSIAQNIKVEDLKNIFEMQIKDQLCKCYKPGVFLTKTIELDAVENFVFNNKIKGKSGSLIFYTTSFKYAIKVIRDEELNFALKNAEKFQNHYQKVENTLITKILGCYTTPKFHFTVMENVFKCIPDQIFDLKGKNLNRSFTSINIEEQWARNTIPVKNKQEIVSTIKRDVEFLQSLNLIDYSFVVGLCKKEPKGFEVVDKKGRIMHSLVQLNQNSSYSIGIVDVLTNYNSSKMLERLCNLLCCFGSKSTKKPAAYAKNFLDLIENDCFDEMAD